MTAKLALFALVSACILPQPAFAQMPGNEAAWAAKDTCAPRVPLKPIADVTADGLTKYPGLIAFRKSADLAGVDLEGSDTNVIGDGVTVNLHDIHVHKVNGGHFFVTGYDEGGNFGGNPILNVDHADIDYKDAQNLSQGNITNNYTAGASKSELHLSYVCLHDAPSDYFSSFLGGKLTLDHAFVSAMCKLAIYPIDHCEVGHINGGYFKAKDTMFDMAAGGGVPCCVTGVLFFDAISTGYDIDAYLDHCVIKGMQSQGFLYPIVLSPGKANVNLHISNCELEKGIHDQYIAGVGPYGNFNAVVYDEGGNTDLGSHQPITLGIPVAPPPPVVVDPRDALIVALKAQVAADADAQAKLTVKAAAYAAGLQKEVQLGTAANATRQGPTKGQVAVMISTAKAALAN
jgi:hypothetical protein